MARLGQLTEQKEALPTRKRKVDRGFKGLSHVYGSTGNIAGDAHPLLLSAAQRGAELGENVRHQVDFVWFEPLTRHQYLSQRVVFLCARLVLSEPGRIHSARKQLVPLCLGELVAKRLKPGAFYLTRVCRH